MLFDSYSVAADGTSGSVVEVAYHYSDDDRNHSVAWDIHEVVVVAAVMTCTTVALACKDWVVDRSHDPSALRSSFDWTSVIVASSAEEADRVVVVPVVAWVVVVALGRVVEEWAFSMDSNAVRWMMPLDQMARVKEQKQLVSVAAEEKYRPMVWSTEDRDPMDLIHVDSCSNWLEERSMVLDYSFEIDTLKYCRGGRRSASNSTCEIVTLFRIGTWNTHLIEWHVGITLTNEDHPSA